MTIKNILIAIAFVATASAFMPVKSQFTAAEQQQVSIATPGLFSRSDAFSIDFAALHSSEYSFPLPVGKAEAGKNASIYIVTKDGDAVKAMFDGTVRLSRKHNEMGNVVVIRHRNGLETVYANNAQNLVEVEQDVKAGQTVAIVGKKDGRTYCEFSIMVNGARINPATIIDLKSHHLRRQTLLCEKKGSRVSVSVQAAKAAANYDMTNIDRDVFEKSSSVKLDLTQIKDGQWAYPLPGSKVISPYGGKRGHSGVDLKTCPKDNIVAAFDGVVTRSGPFSGYGNCIVIRHAYGLETLYSHQYKNLVKAGDHVKAGQMIGLTGRTGRATTEHLHFETKLKGRRFNPAVMFDHANCRLQSATLTLNSSGSISSAKKSNTSAKQSEPEEKNTSSTSKKKTTQRKR
jgi:murein DD-endopeptidase MepM/ murein hydrolase activator NlpD